MEHVTQLANYNDKLEEQVKRASPSIGPTNYGTNQLSTLLASSESITKTKRPVATKTPSAVAVDHPYNACQPPQNNSSNGIGNQNNSKLNRVFGWGQPASSYSKQTLSQMGCPNQYKNPQWNNQKGYSQPWDKRSYPRGRGDNFAGIPERYQARVDNNRDQVCTCRNQYSPIREPKLSRYDGSIPWRVFEVKLLHLAQRYHWDNDTKLAKLVESLEGKALTFFSKLPHNVQCNFEVVRKKMNNRFIPQEPAITVRKNLQTIRQNSEQALEEWAERCQQCAYDAWGEISEDVAELAAVQAFLGGVLETEAAFSVMEKDPQTVDRALELLKKTVHNRRSLSCKFRNTQRTARTVSFAPVSIMTNPTQPDFSEKFESELKSLWSLVAETKKEIVKILELLSHQEKNSFMQ